MMKKNTTFGLMVQFNGLKPAWERGKKGEGENYTKFMCS